jgi:hypothetical protein
MDAGHLVSDLSLLGAEADWMPFFWNLTREDNAWSLGQFFALQRAACGGRLCVHTDNISAEAWVEYEALFARLAPEVGVTADQWNKLNTSCAAVSGPTRRAARCGSAAVLRGHSAACRRREERNHHPCGKRPPAADPIPRWAFFAHPAQLQTKCHGRSIAPYGPRTWTTGCR